MANINLINSSSNDKKGLERTGRIGGNLRNSVNHYELTEHDIMIPKPMTNPNSLSIKVNLD
jgi:hypothetical protein